MNTVIIIAYVITFAVPAFALYAISALDLFGTGRVSTKIICALWGAFGAFALALTVNNWMVDIVGTTLLITVTAPIVEEISKSLILVFFIRQPRFRYAVDGAVYGFATGIGFALAENLYIYLPQAQSSGDLLAGAISRVLAPLLMHATASALVGICLGYLRRTTRGRHTVLPLVGIILAITLHSIFNRVAHSNLDATLLLLIAIMIGIGGSVVIALLINRALAQEKARFSKSLGLQVGVSEGERQSVQRLGGGAFEQILEDLSETFGEENIALFRRLFVVQANIGILENNLAEANVSERLRKAWEEEIAELQTEKDEIRQKLDRYVMSYLANVFPSGDAAMGEAMTKEIADSDPTLVHTFDMFTRQSQLAQSFTAEELTDRAERLQKITYFKNISLANLENLSRAITLEEYPEGKQLFDKGVEGDRMYMIEDGNIAIYTLDRDNREKLLRIFVPGDVVGEIAVLDSGPRSARARAQKNVRVLVLTRNNFKMFIQSRPQVIKAVLEVLADKARYTTRAVEEARDLALKIANGQYDQVQEATPTTAAVTTAPGATTAPAADHPLGNRPGIPDKELAEMSFTSMNRLIKGAFSHLAETLQQREQSLGADSGSAKAQ